MVKLINKKIISLFFISLAAGLYFVFNICSSEKPQEFLSSNNQGFNLVDLGKYIIMERYTPSYSDYDEENVKAQRETDFLKIKTIYNFTRDDFEKYSTNQFLLFEGLFDEKLPPYPEFLTRQTGCGTDFLPSLEESELGKYYLTYADERFNYGLCSWDLVKYDSAFGIFYCENSRKLFKIEYFTPNEGRTGPDRMLIKNLISSFNCI